MVKKAKKTKKHVKKHTKKSGKKGAKYACRVCGMVVRVDNVCGCIDTCDIVCCGKAMKPKR